MVKISKIDVPGFEQVIEAIDESKGLHCFIAIHDNRLGPGLGGTRIYPYANREEALCDALRLAQGMTYKSAVAQVGTGGSKAVIIGPSRGPKSKEMLHAYAELINRLEGQFITAEDVGTTTKEIAVMSEVTPYLVGLPLELGGGDPSPYTAWGVYRGIQAVCQHLFQTDSVRGKKIAIQGLGKVGTLVANTLFWEGAELILSDINEEKAKELCKMYGATYVAPSEILQVECDILSPAALGGIINDETIPLLRCKAVAGAANNQLLEERHGQELMKRGILYAPDFVINAGGLIQVADEIALEGHCCKRARDNVHKIYDSLIAIFRAADQEKLSTEDTAVALAKHNLTHLIGKRKIPFTRK
jgi:leucine dehydrogenase